MNPASILCSFAVKDRSSKICTTRRKGERGSITISFASEDEFKQLVRKLGLAPQNE